LIGTSTVQPDETGEPSAVEPAGLRRVVSAMKEIKISGIHIYGNGTPEHSRSGNKLIGTV
jgi:hypothetical protein